MDASGDGCLGVRAGGRSAFFNMDVFVRRTIHRTVWYFFICYSELLYM